MERDAIRTMLVGDILDRWPETARDFHRRRMTCPGCVMSPFMTVTEVCRTYDIDQDGMIDDLYRTIRQSASADKEPRS